MKSIRVRSAVLVFVIAVVRGAAQSCYDCLPVPIASDVATYDMLVNSWAHGTTVGTLPGFNPTFLIYRTGTEMGSNGLFRVDYVIDPTYHQPYPNPRFSLLFFRPEMSIPGNPTNAPNAVRSPLMRPATTTPNLAIRTIQHSLLGAHSFSVHSNEYAFTGTGTKLAFSTYLPAWFAGMKGEDTEIPRRIQIAPQQITKNRFDMILEHWPMIPPGLDTLPQRVLLSRRVPAYHNAFSKTDTNDAMGWTNRWPATGALPTSVYTELWTKKWFEDDAFDYDWYYDEDDWHYDDEWYFRVDFKGFNTIAIPATPIPASWQSPFSQAPPAARIAEQRAVFAATSAKASKPTKPRPYKQGDVELEWSGRSGVELARYAVAQQRETYDALNQPWAGATWDTNSPLATLPLQGFPLNGGTVSVTIVDLERKANINVVPVSFIERALRLNQVNEAEIAGIVESTADWLDADDDARPQGAETGYYQTLGTPYRARNGLMTEIAELAFVKGSSRELVYGTAGGGIAFPLRDLFTTTSDGKINLNTAPHAVLQLLPGVDATLAHSIVATRAGADGTDGTADDLPFETVAELANVPGMTAEILNALLPYVDVRSATFEATITARLGARVRTYVAWLRRVSSTEVVVLKMRER